MREWQEATDLRNCAAVRSFSVEVGKAGVGSESFGEMLREVQHAQTELRLDTVYHPFEPYTDGITSVLEEWMFGLLQVREVRVFGRKVWTEPKPK
jgi:hypothetical protein